MERDFFESHTLISLPGYQSVHLKCLRCGHFVSLSSGRVRIPPAATLYDLRTKCRCVRCGSKMAQWFIKDKTRRGRRQWIPGHPDDYRIT